MSYVVLQTKSTGEVEKLGLVPGSVGYSLVDIKSGEKGGTEIEVKCRFKHKWKGRLNIICRDK